MATAAFFGKEATEFLRGARPTLISGDLKGLVLGNYQLFLRLEALGKACDSFGGSRWI